MNGNGNSSTSMFKYKKVGEGSYGVVYTGYFKEDDDRKLFAIKRNYKENSASWIGNIHEADVLVRLKGCDFIVNLHKMAIDDPFDESNPMTPNLSSKKDMSEDKIHFIMEYVGTSGEDYLKSSEFSFPNSRLILTQILLGLHYMHKNKIIHRDLKPANILIDFRNDSPYAKICDFGMSCNHSKNVPSTPGVVTCWYRAPEICFGHTDYDYSADVWSFGCLLFEFFTKKPWIYGVSDDDGKIFNMIINKLEAPPSEEDMSYLRSKCSKKFTVKLNDIIKGKRTSFESQLKSNTEIIADYERTMHQNVDDLIDLLRKCLEINPLKRPTVEEILKHKFFNIYRGYIDTNLQQNIELPFSDQVIINDCKERKWAAEELLNIYKTENTNSWYSDIILFHAMDLFDRYIYWVLSEENGGRVAVEDFENDLHGRIHTREETEIRLWTCIYVMHKYYSTLKHPRKWATFFPKKFLNNKQSVENQAEIFEYCLIKNVCKYRIHRDTLFEMFEKYDKKVDINSIQKILLYYCKIGNYLGTYDTLFQQANIAK